MFERVLIANRGEIAVRVMRTLRRLGIESVAVYSDADADARHVGIADRAVRLGPAPAAESYLRSDRVIEAALTSGAQAIHPGYGLLSERADFARACADAELVFIGPSPEAIAVLGDKVAAKIAAEAAGVPIVPGLHRPGLTDAEIADWARTQELPLLLKAAAGGGGKGMRVVRHLDQLPDALAAARREARAAFGEDGMLIERYLERARHVEVQLIADDHGTVLHLGERECSLQRRHQKLVEESPSPVVDAHLRASMGAAATELARSSGYTNAGTVELIVDGDDPSSFYFLELNARLQVEHPVTELVTGLDLVELQLRVAAGEPLGLSQADIRLDGHAIEARVCAEDAANDFLPATGRIVVYREPESIRIDSGVQAGSEVSAHYDSLLAKLIAHGPDRETALARLRAGLAELRLLGPTTNAAYLRALLNHPSVRAGVLDTNLVERLGTEIAPPPPSPDLPALAAVALVGPAPTDDPWDARDGWRPAGPAELRVRLIGPQGEVEGSARPDANGGWVPDAVRRGVDVYVEGKTVWLVDDGTPTRWERHEHSAAEHAAAGSLDAPMPGVVLDVRTQPGATVAEGDVLIVLESMKMELSVVSPAAGVVSDVHVTTGDSVGQGQPLVAVEAP
ncbi:MAG TPA: biotin carboxylase N-terminal domain-containing protein [Thermoleophilaceae bacterium]